MSTMLLSSALDSKWIETMQTNHQLTLLIRLEFRNISGKQELRPCSLHLRLW